jgi:hypothetical protein
VPLFFAEVLQRPKDPAHKKARQDTCRQREIEFEIVPLDMEIAGEFTQEWNPWRQNQKNPNHNEDGPQKYCYFSHASHTGDQSMRAAFDP